MSQGGWPKQKDRGGYSIVDLTGHSKFSGVWRIEGTGYTWSQLVKKVKDGEATLIEGDK